MLISQNSLILYEKSICPNDDKHICFLQAPILSFCNPLQKAAATSVPTFVKFKINPSWLSALRTPKYTSGTR